MNVEIKELAYVALNATDLNAWTHYATAMLGGTASALADVGLRVRFDERDCRLLVRRADEDKLLALGWLLKDEASWQAALEQLRAAGHTPELGSAQECIERRVNAFFWLSSPAGHRHEVGWGPVVNFRPMFVSPLGVRFHTGDQGLGHIVVGCEPQQYEAERDFLCQVLGFQVANIRSQSLGDEPVPMPISWLHCGNPRQHSIGLAPTFTPGVPRHGLRHINIEVADIDDVGMAYDRAQALNVGIVRVLGRHVNDRAISFYIKSPSGFLFEYGCDAPRRDWNSEIVYDEGGVGSLWGHQFVAKH
jgi:3,4-dihydroxy-9,10-secoandrosta-1,3,5(10)-triene-9,17-dione 4,5-dioxygenase